TSAEHTRPLGGCGAVLQARLDVRDQHGVDRQLLEPAPEVGLQLGLGPLAFVLREPVDGELDAPVASDQQVPGDERAVLLEEEEHLNPIAALHRLAPHAPRQPALPPAPPPPPPAT